MNIAIIGAGNVGRTLGRRWSAAGHQVVYGVRSPSQADERTPAQAASEASVVVLSLPWSAVEAVLQEAGDLAGKVLIDATNPILPDFSGLSIGTTDSGGESVARLAPGARVVKAFNMIGFNIMENPVFPVGNATLLIAGDHEGAKQKVKALANDLGFEAVDAGPLEQSRGLEALAWLWISMAMKYGHGREIVFQFAKR